MKICNDWYDLDGIEATCPHCEQYDVYHVVGDTGDIVRCANPKCKKQFKLGEPE